MPDDSLAEYADLWPETPYDGSRGYQPQAKPRAAYAAMVSRFDRSVGRIMERLGELGLDRNTLVLFASDNGPTFATGGYDAGFFQGANGFRAEKGSVYEGGIRVPFVARQPGTVPAGRVSRAILSFPDMLPTLLDAAGAGSRVPPGLDGASRLDALHGSGIEIPDRPFYVEFPGYGGQQMVRLGRWKAVRRDLLARPDAPVELYDLEADPGETTDLRAARPEIAAGLSDLMAREHRPSALFPFPALDR